MTPAGALRALFEAAVGAALPARVADHLPPPPPGRTVVVGAGKASAAMAWAFERAWPGPLSGLVVTRDGHGVPCERIEVVEARHPVPDARGAAAGARTLALAQALGPDDLLVCLISGGGSALWTLPTAPATLAELQALTDALLASGAPIGAINTVRRHLSALAGGRLAAAAWPARCHALLISDVPGDDPAAIASGPTVADPTTCADARAMLARYGVPLPDGVAAVLDGAGESVKPGDERLARTDLTMIATPQMALEAAAALAVSWGVLAPILGDGIEGEARDVATVMAGIARQVARRGQPFHPPCVLLSGGETSVTLRSSGRSSARGRGGRNVEFLLALAIALDGMPGVHALAADTDGIDGAAPVAGAVIGPDTLSRARAAGLDARAMLDANDAHSFFEALGDQVITGPTLTNVNDFRAIWIEP